MSTYSPNLRIELIETGTQAGTWGTTTNTNLGTLLEGAISGFTEVVIVGTTQALTANDGSADQARMAILKFTTAIGQNFSVFAPPNPKQYLVWNASGQVATIYNSTIIGNTTPAGTGVIVNDGERALIFSDGTNFYRAAGSVTSVNVSGGASGLTFSGGPVTSSGTVSIASGQLAVAYGGTGASTASAARSALGAAAAGANSDITSLSGLTTALSVIQGGTGANNAAGARTNLGATTVGANFFGLANPNYVGYTRINADNTIDVLSAASFRTAIGAVNSVGITGTNITVSNSPITDSGNISISIPQAVGTSSSVQFGSFGVGTAASGTTGEIRATNNVTGYYSSDARLKENVQDIQNATDIVKAVGGKTFDWKDSYITEHGGEDGYFVRKNDFGVIAQDLQAVFPLAVRTREDGTLAVDYEKLCAVAFQAIKELSERLEKLEAK